MHLGYFTMPLHPPGSDPARTLADDLEQIVTLDRLGYTEAWIGEHFTSVWENIPCPDLFIAHALARTNSIVLGTGVYLWLRRRKAGVSVDRAIAQGSAVNAPLMSS